MEEDVNNTLLMTYIEDNEKSNYNFNVLLYNAIVEIALTSLYTLKNLHLHTDCESCGKREIEKSEIIGNKMRAIEKALATKKSFLDIIKKINQEE